MGKHTFKVGDLVTCHDVMSLCPDGTKAVVVEVKDGYGGVQIWVKSLDERFKAVNGYFTDDMVHEYLKHDTDFQVGDWVRYEQLQPEGWWGEVRYADLAQPFKLREITENGSGHISGNQTDGGVFKVELNQHCYLSNLVKIQPPQEEKKMDKKEEQVDIVHRETGEVIRDVEYAKHARHTWRKVDNDRETTYSVKHWKHYEEWVKIEVRKPQWETINTQIGAFEARGLDDHYHIVSWRPVK